jgi:hypothetical protein
VVPAANLGRFGAAPKTLKQETQIRFRSFEFCNSNSHYPFQWQLLIRTRSNTPGLPEFTFRDQMAHGCASDFGSCGMRTNQARAASRLETLKMDCTAPARAHTLIRRGIGNEHAQPKVAHLGPRS